MNIPKGGEQLKFMWTEQEGCLDKLTDYRLLGLFYKTDQKFSFLKQNNPGPLQGMRLITAGGKRLFRADPEKFVMTDPCAAQQRTCTCPSREELRRQDRRRCRREGI